MAKYFFLSIFLISGFSTLSQDYKGRYESLDVQEYLVNISLNDTTDQIKVREKITIQFLKPVTSFYLDLVDQNSEKKGMKITQLKEGEKDVQYIHMNAKISIPVSHVTTNEIRSYIISYEGIPEDGLVISKNKYNDRTFFGDNWPTRAKNWIACVDHPSDKASVTFQIETPAHYKAVANGELKYEVCLPNDRKRFEYYSAVAIPTKVMVIGVADFEVQEAGIVEKIPVSSWVYPQNKEEGFYDLAQATEILKFFTHHFGDYPYAKLANVQSTTRFGGMENASCIFYDENSINGKRTDETLIAHEIAHQWFGNTATEMDWPHLWLSEGFATYCTNLYLEEKYGQEAFVKQLLKDKHKVVQFYKTNKTPVIDTVSVDLMYLLNANSYQKGGWVLHMLRRKIGDEFFWKGVYNYYQKFKLKNATSEDFIAVMEETSGMDLTAFFDQWLRQSGHPQIHVEHKVTKHKMDFEVTQEQKSGVVFTFPLEVKLIYTDYSFEIKTLNISSKKENYSFTIPSNVREVILDPNTNLLFEEVK